jgi:hypothetical protein
MIKIYVILLAIVGLCGCNTTKSDDISLSFNIVSNNNQEYLSELDEYDQKAIMSGQGKLAKLYVINKGADMVLLTSHKKTFIVTKWIQGKSTTTEFVHLKSANVRKIHIRHNDSTVIYIPYSSEPDSLFCNVFWQRDSLGLDEIKMYNDKKGNLKYHSSKKITRGNELLSSYKKFEDCPIIDNNNITQ